MSKTAVSKDLTPEQAIKYLGMDCTPASFKRTYLYGKYPRILSYRLGNKRLIEKKSLDEYIKSIKPKKRRQYLNPASS